MSLGPSDGEIISIDRVEIMLERRPWEFAIKRRGEIDRYFARLKGKRALLWNGQRLLIRRYAVHDGVLRGACFETDYASFSAWRHWSFPDPAIANVFAAAALRTADGAYLVGEMAPYTAGAGRVYFPAGTPEPGDLDATGTLDLADNVRRELKEETGLDIDDFAAKPGWSTVIDRGYVAVVKRLAARQSADELRSRIMRHLASEAKPEFVDIHIVRGPDDLDARMPGFVIAFLEEAWRKSNDAAIITRQR
jgi:8-oxo-dGTP pyrophosphatase MutT (NUDIX family)